MGWVGITAASVFSTCVLGSILALLACLVFRNRKVGAAIGPGCMMAILLAIVIRSLLPVEFRYTRFLYDTTILFRLFHLLYHPFLQIGDFSVNILCCLAGVWVLGILVVLGGWIVSYRSYAKYLAACPALSWEQCFRHYALKEEEQRGMEQVRLVVDKNARVPHVFGYGRKYLVLPDVPFQEGQLRYVLQHELMHVQRKDMVWKTIIDVLCVLFWWNPVFWYLRRELNGLLEIRNDQSLTKNFTREEKGEYMRCLVDLAERFAGKKPLRGLAFGRGDARELKRRISMLAKEERVSVFARVCAVVLTTVLLFLTTTVMFSFLPSIEYIKEEEGEENVTEVEPVTRENTFLVKSEGKYDVYVDGEYLYTTEDVSAFEGYVNTYESLGEAEKKQKR